MVLLRRLWLVCSQGETDLLDLTVAGALLALGVFLVAPAVHTFDAQAFRLLRAQVSEPVFGALCISAGGFKAIATLSLVPRARALSALFACALWSALTASVLVVMPGAPFWLFSGLFAAAAWLALLRHLAEWQGLP